jgi:hypothetical protein
MAKSLYYWKKNDKFAAIKKRQLQKTKTNGKFLEFEKQEKQKQKKWDFFHSSRKSWRWTSERLTPSS